ncbi:alpha/beta fold hydrolase [Pedobacter jeongneungensis]|uniref:alpha/beta hydrolase n=1 Tax=Pedobacter jeongneungensis TaxID=947309 RepID=UPI00046AFD60|nr:alpha/beta fold hydrolase [Pedobacter jeongneungensis]
MKKSLLFIIALLFTTSAFSQNVIQLFNSANDFFKLLQEEKFTGAHAFFDDTLKTKLPEESLKKLWSDIGNKFGKAESFDAIQSKAEGEFFAVTVEGKFAKGDQNFIIGFNKMQKIVGIFLAPSKKVTTYLKPAYVDTALYAEKSVYIGPPGKQLAAIITTPKNVKNFPMVVFVHGSGPGDMDETVGANKPFKDLAGGLASKGIGSVRYVKRTLIYPNEFAGPYTVKEEVLDDEAAAIAAAKTTVGADPKNVYVFGHSLGGMLAPKMATLSPDLAGIILAAAPARKLTDIIVDQNKYMFEQANDTSAVFKQQLANAIVEIDKSRISQLGTTIKPDSVILGLPAKYWADLNSYDQVAVAKTLSKPRIYVVQGGNDFQVSKTDFDLWNEALSKKKNVTLKFYPDLNHLLSSQTGKGTMAQYQAAASVSDVLVNDLITWIKAK